MNHNILSSKSELRKHIRQQKRGISNDEMYKQAQYIFYEIEMMQEFQDAQKLGCYWSLSDEVPTHSFIEKWSKSKEIYLPAIDNDTLVFNLFSGKENMQKYSNLGVLQPLGNQISNMDEIDFFIVPGMAFDRNGNRLGRGAGFYDRFFNDRRGGIKVGVAFSFQLVRSIPVNDNDIPMDRVIFGQ